jgi:hypothetical protein
MLRCLKNALNGASSVPATGGDGKRMGSCNRRGETINRRGEQGMKKAHEEKEED